MAIRVRHQPVDAIAQAAIAGGIGEFNQRQQARADQQAAQQAARDMDMLRLAQQDLAQQRGLAANLQSQMLHMAKSDWQRQQDMAFTAQKMQWDAAQKQATDLEDFNRRKELLGLQNQFQVGEMDARMMREWELGGAVAMESEINTLAADMSRNREYLDEEGKLQYAKMAGDLRAIQAARGNLRPADYAAKLAQWRENFERSGIRNRITPPPTTQEQWQQDAVPITDPVTGQPTGGWMVREKNRNGGWTWKEVAKPTSSGSGSKGSKADKVSPYDLQFHEAMGDDDFTGTARKEAISALQAAEKAKVDASVDAEGKPTYEARKEFEPQEIVDQMRRQFEQRRKERELIRGMAPQQGAGQQPAAEQQQAPPQPGQPGWSVMGSGGPRQEPAGLHMGAGQQQAGWSPMGGQQLPPQTQQPARPRTVTIPREKAKDFNEAVGVSVAKARAVLQTIEQARQNALVATDANGRPTDLYPEEQRKFDVAMAVLRGASQYNQPPAANTDSQSVNPAAQATQPAAPVQDAGGRLPLGPVIPR